MLIKKLDELLAKIGARLESNPTDALPGNVYYLDNSEILCTHRVMGESRYPYTCDGYTMWVHSTGYIQTKDGQLNVFKPLYDNTDPSVELFAGIERGDGTYFPISLLGAAKQLFEPFDVKRYLVYSLSAAYFVTDTEFASFVVRADMSDKREMRFSVGCKNKTDKPLKIAFTSYFTAILKGSEYDDMWSIGGRRFTPLGDGSFVMERGNYVLGIKRTVSDMNVLDSEQTVSRSCFAGSARTELSNSECLKTGKFCASLSRIFDIAAEILKLEIDKEGRIDYVLPLGNDREEMIALLSQKVNANKIDREVEEANNSEINRFNNLSVTFEGLKTNNKLDTNILNNFVKSVSKQVDSCAMGRYYVEDKLGIRDVFQQLEQALIWDPKQAKEKIIRALGYIDPSGRPPRQVTIPLIPTKNPQMDLRPYIDQGNWIISCIYTYIAWTGDFSILDEECGYHKITGGSSATLIDEKDSVLDHLVKITDYLISNIDPETKCLRILRGDWNDALDGLGATSDEGKEYGSGVTVMASLHLYQNLFEMTEILKKVGKTDRVNDFLAVREDLKNGLVKYAVVENDKGEKRLIHGWGDKRSYMVGSFCDSDGESRISFAPNAFWASSGLIKETPEYKQNIIDSLRSLDSRFGLLTLFPAFSETTPGVGRIRDFASGTAENACVYIHASMFSIMALFLVGDSDFAWEQLIKVISPSHKNMTMTSFVMTNSYMDNLKRGFDGQSQNDWFTGSGTVFIKNIVRNCIGLNADMNGVYVQPAFHMPVDKFTAEVLVKGVKVTVKYENTGASERTVLVDGNAVSTEFDAMMNLNKAYIPGEMFHEGMKIEIKD